MVMSIVIVILVVLLIPLSLSLLILLPMKSSALVEHFDEPPFFKYFLKRYPLVIPTVE